MNKIQQAKQVFDIHAQAYQDKYMDTSLYHDSFTVFCDAVQKERATVLEVGCGPGNITSYLLQKRPDFRITACDVAPNMLALAKVNNPTATFIELDCRDITTLNIQFDAIVCGFCLPYISKEEAIQFIVDTNMCLKEAGVLYISTMEGDYSTSGYVGASSVKGGQLYTYYHEAAYLLKALKENNFTVTLLDRKRYTTNDGATTTDLLILAKKDSSKKQ